MRRAVLFLILTFAVYAAAQKGGATSSGSAGAASGGTAGAAGMNTGAASTNISPGLNEPPASGPSANAPTTNLGPSTSQPLGTGEVTTGSAGTATVTNNGGFVASGSYGYPGFVPMLQTPEVSFPSGITNVPNNPAGISNMPSALQSANAPSNNGGVFNTGAATADVTPGMPPGKSLGEIAREVRAQQGAQHASRVYTNDDIARLNQNNGQGLESNLGPQSNAQSAPDQGPQTPTTPAVSNHPPQPSQNQNLPGREAQPPQSR